jgi:hypothetical protein
MRIAGAICRMRIVDAICRMRIVYAICRMRIIDAICRMRIELKYIGKQKAMFEMILCNRSLFKSRDENPTVENLVTQSLLCTMK